MAYKRKKNFQVPEGRQKGKEGKIRVNGERGRLA